MISTLAYTFSFGIGLDMASIHKNHFQNIDLGNFLKIFAENTFYDIANKAMTEHSNLSLQNAVESGSDGTSRTIGRYFRILQRSSKGTDAEQVRSFPA